MTLISQLISRFMQLKNEKNSTADKIPKRK